MIDYPPADQALRPLERHVNDWLFSQHPLELPITAISLGTGEQGPAPCVHGRQRDLVVRLGLEDDRTVSSLTGSDCGRDGEVSRVVDIVCASAEAGIRASWNAEEVAG